MTKKNNKGDGSLFSPELREIVRRLKHAEPELTVITKNRETEEKEEHNEETAQESEESEV